jgi:hypothetical protein
LLQFIPVTGLHRWGISLFLKIGGTVWESLHGLSSD